MEYQTIDRAARKLVCQQQLEAVERQHYNLMLQAMANEGIPQARDTSLQQAKNLEPGIALMRKELASYADTGTETNDNAG